MTNPITTATIKLDTMTVKVSTVLGEYSPEGIETTVIFDSHPFYASQKWYVECGILDSEQELEEFAWDSVKAILQDYNSCVIETED